MFIYALEQIKANPESQKWWTYLPIDLASNILIGTCGFKGMPDMAGAIEIGYEKNAVDKVNHDSRPLTYDCHCDFILLL